MIRRLLLVATCLTVLACGGANDNVSMPGSLPEATSPPATDEPGTTSRRSGTSRSSTTRRATTTTTAGGPTTTKGPALAATNPIVTEFINDDMNELGFTTEQRTCAITMADTTLALNPDNAASRPFVAGVVGGALTECIGTAEIAQALGASLRSSDTGKAMTSTQLDCVEKALGELAGTSLATFIGGSLVNDKATTDQVIVPIDTACGTTLSK